MADLGVNLDRRRFLSGSAAALAGAALAACEPAGLLAPDSPGRLPGGRAPQRVAVVGAGMAGLVAAYELARAGHEVTVLEARTRVGGRVETLREPFAPGHLAEAGAARIPPEHDLTLGYARHFGLETDRFYPPEGLFLDARQDQRIALSPAAFLGARPDYVKVRGGTDRLPLAFADALGPGVRLGTPVERIEHDAASVRLVGAGLDLLADRALVTVPVPVLGRIEFSPLLSGAKREAVAGGFAYQTATRVFVRFQRRFWEDDGYNGWAVSDWPEEVWHPTWDLPGPEGLLLTYVRGDRARELDALGPAGAAARVLEHWEGVFPGARELGHAAAIRSWSLDPWAGAAWAAPTSLQDAELGPDLERPEGRVHFAGEHLSGWRGWMQGALASGLRAAEAIHATG